MEVILTVLGIAAMPRHMGRKKQWAEDMQARFAEGTFARIAALLVGSEDRTDFVRAAVEREIDRREREAKRSGKDRHANSGGSGADHAEPDGSGS
jgi:hypothetical protein